MPAPVLAQAWRNDEGKQSRLSLLLKGCIVEPTTERVAKAAGLLLGSSHTSDVVDAIVVATALPLNAHVVTSNMDDLNKLAGSAKATLTLIPV